MEFLKDNKTYNAAIYVRLSRDDGDKVLMLPHNVQQ